MRLAAEVYPTNLYHLTQQPNNSGCTSGNPVRTISICLEVVSLDLLIEIEGNDFFCVLKENFNG
jgi:hypothetical protein